MRASLAIVVLLGCSPQPAPRVTAPLEATSAAESTTVASAPSSEPSSALPSEPPKVEAAKDACEEDSDCALTRHQDGCCASACETYAMNKARLAEIEKKEDCATVRKTKTCPPPAPCPPEKRKPPQKAKCYGGTCRVIAVG